MESFDLIRKWGLSAHPFGTGDAKDEENLQEVFLEPPYFGDILGDPANPKSTIVHGQRGDGKSAAREMIFAALNDPRFRRIIVNYDRFDHFSREQARNANLESHLMPITFHILNRILLDGEIDAHPFSGLSQSERADLTWLLLRFTPSDLKDQYERRLQGIYHIAFPSKSSKRFFRKTFGSIGRYLKRKRFEMEQSHDTASAPVELVKALLILISPRIPISGKLGDRSVFDLFVRLRDLSLRLGYRDIVILIDNLDEAECTSDDLELTATLFRPLLASLQFLKLDKVATKLFIPSDVRNFIGSALRTDRLTTRVIEWSDQMLEQLVNKRLIALSGGRLTSLQPLVDSDYWSEFHRELFIAAAKNPRNLIRILGYIVAEMCEISEHPDIITREAFSIARKHFLDERLSEPGAGAYLERVAAAREQIH
ncbi:MAG: P-loop ATPase, Sll1717 family [Longimicrobiaceae bacterium]